MYYRVRRVTMVAYALEVTLKVTLFQLVGGPARNSECNRLQYQLGWWKLVFWSAILSWSALLFECAEAHHLFWFQSRGRKGKVFARQRCTDGTAICSTILYANRCWSFCPVLAYRAIDTLVEKCVGLDLTRNNIEPLPPTFFQAPAA